MEVKELTEKRHNKVMEILRHLNASKIHGRRDLYDCGELGCVLIYWGKAWEWEWFSPNKEFLPERR